MNALPDCVHSYLMTGLSENTLTTKIAYARDIKYFLEFAVSYYPYFSDKTIKEITMEDLEQITAEDINVYLFTMKDLGLGEKTRARKKSAISACGFCTLNSSNCRKITSRIRFCSLGLAVRVVI